MRLLTSNTERQRFSKDVQSVLQTLERLRICNCRHELVAKPLADIMTSLNTNSTHAALGNGNTVGAIHHFFGSRVSIASAITVFRSD